MTATRAWIIYALTRLGSFVVPFVAIMLILPDWQWNWLVGIVVGAVVSASISQIFLSKHRAVMAEQMAARRAEKVDHRAPIDIEEDALLDEYEAAQAESAATTPPTTADEAAATDESPATGENSASDNDR